MDRYDKKTRRERQNVHPRISDHCVHDHYAQLILFTSGFNFQFNRLFFVQSRDKNKLEKW